MKKNKKLIGFIAALLFGFGFVVIIRISQNLNPLDTMTAVFGTTNLLSVLGISCFFNKILTVNSTKSVKQLKKRIIPSFIFSLLGT
ncbi:MAG: hypothetical protein LBJ23_00965, partial [Tannerella sp.]|nr:hypothetical protein [Tannerella sp.]